MCAGREHSALRSWEEALATRMCQRSADWVRLLECQEAKAPRMRADKRLEYEEALRSNCRPRERGEAHELQQRFDEVKSEAQQIMGEVRLEASVVMAPVQVISDFAMARAIGSRRQPQSDSQRRAGGGRRREPQLLF